MYREAKNIEFEFEGAQYECKILPLPAARQSDRPNAFLIIVNDRHLGTVKRINDQWESDADHRALVNRIIHYIEEFY